MSSTGFHGRPPSDSEAPRESDWSEARWSGLFANVTYSRLTCAVTQVDFGVAINANKAFDKNDMSNRDCTFVA